MVAPSSLISYLCHGRYLIKGKKTDEVLTHLLMDGAKGGKVVVPHEAMLGFFEAYGRDIEAGVPLYVVENRTPVFKLCFDVDFKILHAPSVVGSFAKIVGDVVAKYFQGSSLEASFIVCAVTDEKGDRKAPGLHLIFPFARVTSEMAQWIRAGVVHALHRDMDHVNEQWGTVIDIAVITSCGLRMVGSDKCRECKGCKNNESDRQCCSVCNRQGKVAENKVYWPWAVYPEDDAKMIKCLEDMKKNPCHAARLCSIRCEPHETPSNSFQVPPLAPGCGSLKRIKPGADDSDRTHVFSDDSPVVCKKSVKRLEINEGAKYLLEQAVRKYHPAYGALQVKEVMETTGKGPRSVWVKVRGYGSRFCLNKDADHTSQAIYFLVTVQNGIAQRCFSKKDVERKCGTCAKFRSAWKPISMPLRKVLFQDDEKQRVPDVVARQNPAALKSINSSVLYRSAQKTGESIAQLPTKVRRIIAPPPPQ